MYGNRASLENTNFETFVPKTMKFHTLGDLHTTNQLISAFVLAT